MAGRRSGTASIVEAAKRISRMVTVYGAGDLTARTSADFTACIVALVECYAVLAGTDDLLLQIDRHAPFGPEDLEPI